MLYFSKGIIYDIDFALNGDAINKHIEFQIFDEVCKIYC